MSLEFCVCREATGFLVDFSTICQRGALMGKLRFNFFDSHLSFLFIVSILFVLLLGLPFSSMAESVGCDDDFVQLDDNALVINVATTGVDDTANIQCALDVAASDGYPIVRLAAGTYFIGGLLVENFKGTLEGRTVASTVIEILDRSINCVGMESAGLSSSIIKFVGGEPRIRFMTINISQPCMGWDEWVRNVLHFTGQAASPENCDNDVIFGVVDRLAIDGAGIPITAISVSAEGSTLEGCTDTLLGTFKLNRSVVSNTYVAVNTAMKAGAQVDINFNEFRDNLQTILLKDTNQNTTITTNKFFGGNSHTIIVRTSKFEAPKVTRVVIHNNEFNKDSASGTVISLSNDHGGTDTSCVITKNRFNLDADGIQGISSVKVSNAHVSANHFSGRGFLALWMDWGTGWTITANTGLADFTSTIGGNSDIFLDRETSQNIVGPDQGAIVRNNNAENIILPQ